MAKRAQKIRCTADDGASLHLLLSNFGDHLFAVLCSHFVDLSDGAWTAKISFHAKRNVGRCEQPVFPAALGELRYRHPASALSVTSLGYQTGDDERRHTSF